MFVCLTVVNKFAEGQGFEPWVPTKEHNGFRDRPFQPLRHPSENSIFDLSSRSSHFLPTPVLRNRSHWHASDLVS